MYIFKIKYIFKDLINNEYKHDKHIIQLFYFLLFINLILKERNDLQIISLIFYFVNFYFYF